MYSEENIPRKKISILTICSILYIISTILWYQSWLQWLLFTSYLLVIHRLWYKIHKKLSIFSIFVLVFHTICGKLRIFVPFIVAVNIVCIYAMNINKKDLLHFLSIIIPTPKVLYCLLFLFYVIKYSWRELKNYYDLAKEFQPYLFYRHLFSNIRLSIKSGKKQAKKVIEIYQRLYYGYRLKKRGI